MPSFVSGIRGWALAVPLVALPLACGEGGSKPAGGTNAAAAAGSAGRTGSAGRAGSAQGGEGGEPGASGGQAGEVGGEAGEMSATGGRGGNGATGGRSGGRGGKGGGAGTVSDGGAMSVGGAISVGGSNAEGGAAAEGGEVGECGAAAFAGSLGVGGGGGTAGDVGGTAGTAGDSAGVGGTAGDSASGGAGAGGTAGTSAGTAGIGGGPTECGAGIQTGEACYTGSQATRGVGICRDGVRFCPGGPCIGEVTPSPEACNGEDDDCDGAPDEDFGDYTCGVGACATSTAACVEGTVDQCTYRRQTTVDGCNGVDDDCDGGIDEDCASTCLKVALTGDDAAAAASNGATPFRNVQTAIDYAAANQNAPKRVCIASGPSCASGTAATFAGPSGSPLTMRDGIDVAGKYESTNWTRCTNGSNVTTVLAPATAEGVLFPAAITSPTVLFGVTVDRANFPTTAGVTVDGAKNVLLAYVRVTNSGVAAESSYGVNVVNGADARLFQCTINGGRASSETMGVRAAGATALIEESTVSGKAVGGDGFSVAILFDSAPGSRVTGSTVSADFARPDWDVMGILVTGDATGVGVDHSTVTVFHPRAYEARTAIGIGLFDCAGTPWITTSTISVDGLLLDEATGIGIDADGCFPSIDQNTSIHAQRQGSLAGIGNGPATYGVRCTANDPDGCTVAGNTISGETWSGGSIINVACRGTAGCGRVSRNLLIGRRANYGSAPSGGGSNCQSSACGRGVTGVSAGRLIDGNDVQGGCSLRSSGISGARAAIGNIVRGHTTDDCYRSGPNPNDPLVPAATGEHGISGSYLDGNSVTVAATTHIESSGVFRAASLGRGVYVRNSFNAGDNDTVVVEGDTPYRFQNNRVRGNASLYYDVETQTTLTSAAQINALTDMLTGGNTQ